MKYHETR